MVVLLAIGCQVMAPDPVFGFSLSRDPENPVFIHLPESSDEKIRVSALDLAEKLERIFRKPFPLKTDGAGTGIFLGTTEDYPEYSNRLDMGQPGGKETYCIHTHGDKLMLVGASPLGVQNAVWDFLHRLGYRQYFPSKKWEIIPQIENIQLDLDVTSSPDFATRWFFIHDNTWPELRNEYGIWEKKNRLESGFKLDASHAYQGIMERNRAVFEAHPEYLTRELGASDNKFVIANPDLRHLVVEDAIRRLEKNPKVDSITMEPSDGENWPETSPLGSVTDQVVTLANEVAAALREKHPGIKVGILAYNEHSPPPSINIDKDIIVTIATGFIRGGYTFEELIDAWGQRLGDALGIYDYLGIWPWDNELPGKAKATSPEFLADQIRSFYKKGGRYFTAEMSHGFAPCGLGLYVAARCLWDVSEADNVADIKEDFFQKSFGSAAQAMKNFYSLIDGKSRPLLSEPLIGDMYRALQSAYATANDEDTRRRIDDFVAYTRFVELYREYLIAKGEKRQQAFETVAQYAKQIRSLGMVHTWAMLQGQSRYDNTIQYSAKGILSGLEEYTAPTREDYARWVQHGVDNYKSLSFKTRGFGKALRPISEITVVSPERIRWRALDLPPGGGKVDILYTYLPSPDHEIRFRITGGKSFGDRGDIKIRVYPALETHGQAIVQKNIPSDKKEHEVIIHSNYEGLHRMEIEDGSDWTVVSWPSDLPVTLPLSQDERSRINNTDALYFFVPSDTETIGGYALGGKGDLRSPDGQVVLRFDEASQGSFHVPVPPHLRGTVWSLRNTGGNEIYLLTVPPYVSPSRRQLLIPEDAPR